MCDKYNRLLASFVLYREIPQLSERWMCYVLRRIAHSSESSACWIHHARRSSTPSRTVAMPASVLSSSLETTRFRLFSLAINSCAKHLANDCVRPVTELMPCHTVSLNGLIQHFVSYRITMGFINCLYN